MFRSLNILKNTVAVYVNSDLIIDLITDIGYSTIIVAINYYGGLTTYVSKYGPFVEKIYVKFIAFSMLRTLPSRIL